MQNPFENIFDRRTKPKTILIAVAPPKTGERTMLGVENMLASISAPEPFSLELAGDAHGVTLMARCTEGSVVKQQLAAHYPQAAIHEVHPHEDPMLLQEGEQAWSTTLRLRGPEFLPLRTFHDRDLLDQGSDPIIALIGSLSNLDTGERVSARLQLQSLGTNWSQHHREHAPTKRGPEPNAPPYTYHTRPLQMDGLALAALGGAALIGLQSYLWIQDDQAWKAALLTAGAASAAALAGWIHWRAQKKRRTDRMHDPRLIEEKTSRAAFDARLELTAVLSTHGRRERADELLSNIAAAYQHYDNPAGARFQRGRVRPTIPTTTAEPPRQRPFQRRNVLGVREAAALWHPPGAADDLPLVERSGPRTILPSARSGQSGAHVGHANHSTAGRPRNIYFPNDLLKRHQLYVARTRMGKSTLMHHIITHKMNQKADGADHDAIVVIDPHADLVNSLLQHVPTNIIDQVRLIDLADESRAPGINLLDTRVFQDRDRTADSVVRVARGLWDQWGPRMQSILEHVVKTLHEANDYTDPDQQSTILDGLTLLTDSDFRGKILARVQDPFLLQWWTRDFANWHRQYRADALAPVQTRLAYYASSKRARAILGQPKSTIDIHKTISNGGILLVSTSQATAGRDVAALVGASILNLVDSVIREQGTLPPHQRTGTLVTIDEMQSIQGVDYEAMLSELGKFGASFILATQSLAKLEDLSPTMQHTILANTSCLAVFQAAAADARRLTWELDKDKVSEEDIASLPVHHCYVRATIGDQRLPTFSMTVRKPQPGDPYTANRIRDAAAAYTTPARTIAAAEARQTNRAEQIIQELARPTSPPMQQPIENADDARPERLERRNLVESIPHATNLIPPTRRFALTHHGILQLARINHSHIDYILQAYPVSEHWRRTLLHRLDATAVIYRLAATAATTSYPPIHFQWFRASPIDAAFTFANQRTIAVIRRGPTSDPTPFAKRIHRLANEPIPSAVLILTTDQPRLQHTRRLLAKTPAHAFIALEGDAANSNSLDPIWHTPSAPSPLDLHHILQSLKPAHRPHQERTHQASMPNDLHTREPHQPPANYLLPSILKPTEKRILDSLSDWPWITPANLANLLDVSTERVYQLLKHLHTLDLVTTTRDGVRRRLALTDRAITTLARRDRTSIAAALKRWSARPIDTDAPLEWRNVSGSKTRQLLRNIHHTHAVHLFLATLAAQARTSKRQLIHIDPPHRATRHFHHHRTLHSIHPDAFGILNTHHRTHPFFLEWERRATLPSTMTARLAPYIRYFSTPHTTEEHNTPALLVVFDDPLPAARFLSLAHDHMQRTNTQLPLWVSHKHAIEQHGPLGPAWRPHTNTLPTHAFI